MTRANQYNRDAYWYARREYVFVLRTVYGEKLREIGARFGVGKDRVRQMLATYSRQYGVVPYRGGWTYKDTYKIWIDDENC